MKHDVKQLGWTEATRDPKPGCFLVDPPMGLGKDQDSQAFSLSDIVQLLVKIFSGHEAPYTVVLYSLYSQQSVQTAIGENEVLKDSRFSVSSFIMIKVLLSTCVCCVSWFQWVYGF